MKLGRTVLDFTEAAIEVIYAVTVVVCSIVSVENRILSSVVGIALVVDILGFVGSYWLRHGSRKRPTIAPRWILLGNSLCTLILITLSYVLLVFTVSGNVTGVSFYAILFVTFFASVSRFGYWTFCATIFFLRLRNRTRDLVVEDQPTPLRSITPEELERTKRNLRKSSMDSVDSVLGGFEMPKLMPIILEVDQTKPPPTSSVSPASPASTQDLNVLDKYLPINWSRTYLEYQRSFRKAPPNSLILEIKRLSVPDLSDHHHQPLTSL